MEARTRLKSHLDRLYATYGSSYLSTDPVQYPRRHARDDDREVAAFIASALAYGRVAQVHRSVESVLGYLGERPARRVRTIDPRRAARDLRGFTHRFNTGRDMACLFHILGRVIERYGSLNEAFLAGMDPVSSHIGPALSGFCREALSVDVSPLFRSGRIPAKAGVRFFFSSPEDGSTCKRMNLFLRWMVRRDEVDLGVWRGVRPSQLVMPLDTHVARISRFIGLSTRRTTDWRMALAVTETLKDLDPEDPVRYDFAICRLGILDACPSRRDPIKCSACDLREICTLPAAAVGCPAAAAATAPAPGF